MLNVYKLMESEHLIMSFISDFTREKFSSLLSMVKECINKPDMPILTRNRLYAISVESLDNILKYINETKDENLPLNFRSNLFIISELEDYYEIRTGSYILYSQKRILQHYINHINTMTHDELKDFYRKKLTNSKPEGGGLGIIEMALKTKNKIVFEFLDETENVSLFIAYTRLQKENGTK